MTLEDPFYVVKDEVFKALNKTRGLYLRWLEISKAPIIPRNPEVEWTSTELRNALRSIEWDLEDLEDTISIVERNSSKFKVDNKEISDRRNFIEATKKEIKMMKSKMNLNRPIDDDGTAATQPLLLGDDSPLSFSNKWTSTPKYSRYAKLANEEDNTMHLDNFDEEHNEQLEIINNTVSSLNSVSKRIGSELNDQTSILIDLNTEIDSTNSKIEASVNKVARVLRMNNDHRQWIAMITLIFILFLVLILFIIL